MTGTTMTANEIGKALPDLNAIVALDDDRLAQIDIALLNLVCACGLPGAGDVVLDALLLKLNDWVHEIRHQIRCNWYRFLGDPADYENSPAYFHILVLITTLQRDLGVRYNPQRVKDPKFQDPYCVNPDFRDSQDLFIHGILNGPGGTCASMPVLYTAACRRLGFPVYLVEAKDHLYCRWDDIYGQFFPRERFNIEGSGQGFGMYPDSFYETWPRKLTDFDRENGAYSKCLSPREELACFLTTRGHCLLDNGRRDEAIECFRWSAELAPHDKRYWLQLDSSLNPNRGHYYIPSRNPNLVGGPVKFSRGNSAIGDPSRGIPVRYAAANQIECEGGWRPEPGRVYKVAAGRPLPTCLPPGTPMRIVPADQADDFSAFEAVARHSRVVPQFATPPKSAFAPNQPRPRIGGQKGISIPGLPAYQS